jgi:hypothetical protein
MGPLLFVVWSQREFDQPVRDLKIGLAKFEEFPLDQVVTYLVGKPRAFFGASAVILGFVQGARASALVDIVLWRPERSLI